MKDNLGRLNRYEVRKIWENENDFSNWLFKQDSLDLLCETLKIDPVQPIAREDKIGDLKADIYCITAGGVKVIIENQFETSNHEHLGKIITYAAGKDASTIIWLVERARPEHTSAIEWLNNITQKGFFLVEIELWKIGNSEPAPKFNIVEQPNEYIQAQKNNEDPTKQFRYAFWSQFIDYSSNDKQLLKKFPGTDTRTPSGDQCMNFYKGCNGRRYQLEALLFTKNSKLLTIGCGVWISDDKELYNKFQSHMDDIQKELGISLEWSSKDTTKASSIRMKHEVSEGEDFKYCNEWLSSKLIHMQEVFNKFV